MCLCRKAENDVFLLSNRFKNMIVSSPMHLNIPATSQGSLLHSSQSLNLKTSPTSFQASNWTSPLSSKTIIVSNLFQVLKTDSDTPFGKDDQKVFEVNNNSNDVLLAEAAKGNRRNLIIENPILYIRKVKFPIFIFKYPIFVDKYSNTQIHWNMLCLY